MKPPPGGPAIVAVVERRTSQEILLATDARTPGQNSFRVQLKEHADGLLSPLRVVTDMRTALPGIPMRKSPYYVQNRYGPFGYGIGRNGADLCIYGWQGIRGDATLLANQGFIDVRVRLCETGATEQKLLSVMYGYTIDAFVADRSWNPYGTPAPPPPLLGARGPDIYPLGATRFETVVEPLPLSKPRKKQPPASVNQPPTTPAPEPHGPLVPPPPAGAATGTPAPGEPEATTNPDAAGAAPTVPPPPPTE